MDGLKGWLKEIWGDFTRQHGDLAAGAVAIFSLLALVPVMLLAVWVFIHVVAKSPQAAWNMLKPHLEQLLQGSSAGGSQILTAVHGLIQSNRMAGLVGVIGLVWSGSRVFNIITEALNEAWRIPHNRSFIKQNLMSVFMLLVLGVVFLLSIGLAAAASYSMTYADRLIHFPWANTAAEAVSIALNVLTSIALFVVLYKWAPNRNVPWKAAIFGGVLSGLFWALFQQIFRWYLNHFASYNRAYGAMGTLVILILWAYYSAYILVLGSVASAVYSERVLGQRGPDHATEKGGKVKRLRGEELSASTAPPSNGASASDAPGGGSPRSSISWPTTQRNLQRIRRNG